MYFFSNNFIDFYYLKKIPEYTIKYILYFSPLPTFMSTDNPIKTRHECLISNKQSTTMAQRSYNRTIQHNTNTYTLQQE